MLHILTRCIFWERIEASHEVTQNNAVHVFLFFSRLRGLGRRKEGRITTTHIAMETFSQTVAQPSVVLFHPGKLLKLRCV